MRLSLLFLAMMFGVVHGFVYSKNGGHYHPSLLLRPDDSCSITIMIRLNLSNDDNDINTNDSSPSSNDNNNNNHGKKSHTTMEHDLNQEINKRSQQTSSSLNGENTKSPSSSVIPIPPVPSSTTTTTIQFRQQERELLRELLDGDDAVAKLRQLWFGERGPKMAAPLALANACIGKGPTRTNIDNNEEDNWTKAERILLELIDQDDTFLEPFVRLSKLYTLQGRFADSQQICLALFAQRPWHYVVLETMVVNTMVLEHNQDLKRWASKRLPPPSLKQERRAWVTQAIADSIRLEEESSVGLLEQTKKVMDDNEDPLLDWQ